MWQEISAVLGDWQFWLKAGVSIFVWYVLAVSLANLHFNGGADPFASARRGAWLSMWVTAVVAAVVSWYWWHDVLLSILLTLVTLILPTALTLMLLSFEPSRAR